MRKSFAAGLLILCMGGGITAAQEEVVDTEGIKSLLGQLSQAWEGHNPEELAGLWVSNGDYVSATGEVARGRVEIAKIFEQEHEGYMRGTTIRVTLTRTRALGDDKAFVDCDLLLRGVRAGGRSIPPLGHRLSAVVVKSGGEWRFLAARLSVPVPSPPQ